MIVTRLSGGLGNQMFQYAAGLSLATRHNVPLRLDISQFNTTGPVTPRTYKLSAFNIHDRILSWKDLPYYLVGEDSLVKKVLSKVSGYNFYYETKFTFEPEFFKLGPNSILNGYFQSPKYFEMHEKQVREHFGFSVKGETSIIDKIINVNAVAIHIRRGDYLSNPTAKNVHGVLPLGYYHEAVKRIREKISDPVFFVFSDDLDWAKKHLVIDGSVYFIDSDMNEHHDLQYMSLCRHFIIANSSFSWWAAYLSVYPGKIVFAPRTWFIDPQRNSLTADLLPSAWIRI